MPSLFDDGPEPEMKLKALAPWAGSNRMLAPIVGKELGKLDWCGVVFAGGMAEVPYIQSREILVNDLHRDIINLANMVSEEKGSEWLSAAASKLPFHPDVIAKAQAYCKATPPPLGWKKADGVRALWYFVAVWMGRSAMAGTDKEFDGNLSARFTASGGGSNVRFRSAIDSLDAWHQTLRRCEFSVLDFRDFLKRCKDRKGHGLYCDPPFPDVGGMYAHKFTETDHRLLAKCLHEFKEMRVVIRYYEHPLVRELYPEGRWTYVRLKGRDQTNNDQKQELLIINGKSFTQ